MTPSRSSNVHETICRWLEESSPDMANQILLHVSDSCCNITVLDHIKADIDLEDGWHYVSYEESPCSAVPAFVTYYADLPAHRTGALRFHFANEDGRTFEALVASNWISDQDVVMNMAVIASVAREHEAVWMRFAKECGRIGASAIPYQGKVYIIGGVENTFDTDVLWEDIYLPDTLKEDILHDIDSFFSKGVEIYQRLNIKPFRKLLFAGVPGTGKTMLCAAITHWGHQNGCFVIYVSGSNQHGAAFWKIHQALNMAASSAAPTIIIVEEFDAYLDEDSKAQLLNVLDGSESPSNPYGTVLLATTNHPDQIDDRVLKRPGRLDRIFIIPEMNNEEDAERMLSKYLGKDWQPEHRSVVPDLVGKPGAFIREVALYALMTAAYKNLDVLPVEILRQSLDQLNNQIEAKDDFLTSHKRRSLGLMGIQRAPFGNSGDKRGGFGRGGGRNGGFD